MRHFFLTPLLYIRIYLLSVNRHHLTASITLCKKEKIFSGIFFDISKVFTTFATN